MNSYCGLDCEHCDAFVATKTDDNRLKARVAEQWSTVYGRKIHPEEIDCGGCTCVGTHGIYCDTMCRAKPCCREKGLVHCGVCQDFPCEKLAEIFAYYPEAKVRLEKAAARDKGANKGAGDKESGNKGAENKGTG